MENLPMRVFRMIAVLAIVFGPVTGNSTHADEETCLLRLQFADAETRIVVPGLVQFGDAEGKKIHIPQYSTAAWGCPTTRRSTIGSCCRGLLSSRFHRES
jgi:hypothetical protein